MSIPNSMQAGSRAAWPLMVALGGLLLGGCDHPDAPPAPAAQGQMPGPQPPPAIAYPSHIAAGGIVPPGGTLTNPHKGDKAIATAGANLFNSMNCDGCHGPDASGAVGPNLGDGRWRYGGTDAEIFSSIYYGRPKGMPAFGGALGQDGVWVLVTYLQSLAPPDNLPTESFEPAAK
jgi:cytochrome c oxidase cbb3-type subunit 3